MFHWKSVFKPWPCYMTDLIDFLLLHQVLPVGIMGLALSSHQTLQLLQLLVSPGFLNIDRRGHLSKRQKKEAKKGEPRLIQISIESLFVQQITHNSHQTPDPVLWSVPAKYIFLLISLATTVRNIIFKWSSHFSLFSWTETRDLVLLRGMHNLLSPYIVHLHSLGSIIHIVDCPFKKCSRW